MTQAVELVVRAGDCPCPGTPHIEEVLYLEPELTMPMASAGMASLRETETVADVEAGLTAAFLPRAIRSWTFLERDADGNVGPVEISRDNLERLVPFDGGGYELIERVGELYMGRFMRPLVARMSKLSQPTSTDDSMPPTPPSGTPRRGPSRPSSPTNGAGKQSGVPAR